jgi:hypothetical protein
MMKRAIARLLLFGVPFTFGYLATRPARPAESTPRFVICASPDGQMRVTANAADCARGSAILVPAGRSLPEVDINGSDQTVNLPF